ncbi:MAG: hypothetical protein ACYTFG_10140 [Planctomycetota bacterium]|jgi:hypothetical protein
MKIFGFPAPMALGFLLLAAAGAWAADQPPELGAVTWLRDFDAGRGRARKSGKPILLLFSEVPG